MSPGRAAWLLWATLLSGCGSPTSIQVEIDVSAYQVPDQLDAVHLQLLDDTGLFAEQTFALGGDDDARPSITLVPGPGTPERFTLRVYGFHQRLEVSMAEHPALSFRDGEELEVIILLP